MSTSKIRIKEIVTALLALVFSFSIVSGGGWRHTTFAAAGIGTIETQTQYSVAPGANLTKISARNSSGAQKIYTLEYDPANPDGIKPLFSHGNYVKCMTTLSGLIQKETDNGYTVVAAMNGDRFESLPYSIEIRDGRIMKGSRDSAFTMLGFYADGTAVLGKPETNFYANSATLGSGFFIERFNEGIWDDANCYGARLFTEDYAAITDSTKTCVLAVLTLNAGSEGGFRIGSSVSATVKSVSIPSGSIPINKGEIILAAAPAAGSYFSKINNLAIGETVTISAEVREMDNSFGTVQADWSRVEQAIGGDGVLVKNGAVPSPQDAVLIHSPGNAPRTAVGIKPDGSVVVFAADGRWGANVAVGLSFVEIGQYFVECGVSYAVSFDGGGSTMFAARLPGEETAQVINNPSDGKERIIPNGLMFVSKATGGGQASDLHISVENVLQTGAATVMENTELNLSVKATDAYGFPVTGFGNVVYSAEGGIGSVDGNVFAAKSGAGSGKIVATLEETPQVRGELDVEVVDALSRITASTTIISLAPSASKQLNFLAYSGVRQVFCNIAAFSFTLEPSTLGAVDQTGLFVAADTQGVGELTVSYKSTVFKIPVEVGKLPDDITGWEGNSFEEIGWGWTYVNPSNGGGGSMSLNTDERYVKYGDSSLKIEYDFVTKPVVGTVSIEGNVNSASVGSPGNYAVAGAPTAIGCWVYGDGNNGWFRIQATNGQSTHYVGDTSIDWVGWKYIESPIPAALQGGPITITRSVRLVQTASGNAIGKKGAIYVDGLRVVYNFKNDDRTNPVVISSSPADGGTAYSRNPEIKITIADLPGNSPSSGELNPPFTGSPTSTGINLQRTRLYVNGSEITDFEQVVGASGNVEISCTSLSELELGSQACRLKFEDNYGNISYHEWTFTVSDDESPIYYNITIPTGTGYTITGASTALHGSTEDYTIIVDEGYVLNFVKANGTALTVTSGSFTLANITADVIIEVNISEQVPEPIYYDITIPAGTGYTITGASTALHGSTEDYTIIVEEGYVLNFVKANGTALTVTSGSFALANITSDVIIEVSISEQVPEPIYYDITIPTGTGYTITGDTTALSGSDKEFSIIIVEGYILNSVKVNGDYVDVTNNIFRVNNINEDITIEVSVSKPVTTPPSTEGCGGVSSDTIKLYMLLFSTFALASVIKRRS